MITSSKVQRLIPLTSLPLISVYCATTLLRVPINFFDDIRVTGDPFTDRIPPECESLEVVSSHELKVIFSEEVDVHSAEQTTHYRVSGIGHPLKASLQDDRKTVALAFADPFPNGVESMLEISQVRDTSGNRIAETKRFLFVL